MFSKTQIEETLNKQHVPFTLEMVRQLEQATWWKTEWLMLTMGIISLLLLQVYIPGFRFNLIWLASLLLVGYSGYRLWQAESKTVELSQQLLKEVENSTEKVLEQDAIIERLTKYALGEAVEFSPYPVKERVGFEERSESENALSRSVYDLNLSDRAANCLKNADIKTIADLVQKSEKEMSKYFGKISLSEIKELLHGMGLSLGVKAEEAQDSSTETSTEAGREAMKRQTEGS